MLCCIENTESVHFLLFAMGGHDHCAAPSCKFRRGDYKDGRKLSFHKFPSDEDGLLLWLARVKRKDLTLENVTKNTVLCSDHFHEGVKTEDQPHPVKFEHGTYPLRRKGPASRPPVVLQKQCERVDVQQKILTLTEKIVGLFQPKSLQSLCMVALVSYHTSLTAAINDRCQVFKSTDYKNNPGKFAFYTGLPNFAVFTAILEYIQPQLPSLYIRSGNEALGVTPLKLGRPRSLSHADELYLTLMFLRHALKEDMLADMFGLSSKSQVSYILTSWIPFLCLELGPFLCWPTRADVLRNHPPSFKDDAECCKCRIIIDCFEVEMQKPSSLSVNAMTYSDYKGRNTFKVLVGVTSIGYVSFVSKAYPGAISDPAITRLSGLLEKLEAGDAIMADKGFVLTGGDLQPRGLTMVLPPFKMGDQQMTAGNVARNRKVANRRIVVENAIGRMRVFDILHKKLPLKFANSGLVSQIVKLVAILANFGPPLR